MFVSSLCLLACLVGVSVGDKSASFPSSSNQASPSYTDSSSSYSAPVGSSYSVPLSASYSAPKPASAAYTVSASDLDRSDQESASSSYHAQVGSSYGTGSSYSSGSSFDSSAPTFGNNAVNYGSSVSSYSAPSGAKTAEVAPAVEAQPKSDTEQSSYEAPAPATSYESQQPVSTGNLYYYYYPVAAHPIEDKVDNSEEEDIDTLLLILVPVVILLGGLSLLNAAGVITFNGRSFGRQSPLDSAFGSFSDLQSELDAMLLKYYDALESESCMDRTVCELGAKANNLSGKEWLLSALDWVIPTTLSSRIATFKEAAREGYDAHACRKYKCDADKIIETRRK